MIVISFVLVFGSISHPVFMGLVTILLPGDFYCYLVENYMQERGLTYWYGVDKRADFEMK